MTAVISNASPLIGLCKIDLLYVLKELWREVTIPEAVYRLPELHGRQKGAPVQPQYHLPELRGTRGQGGQRPESGPAGIELVVGDIRDQGLAEKACSGIDVIVHLAANTGVIPSIENPMADCTVNVIGTVNFLEAARKNGVTRFVFASSGAPLGEQVPPIHENMVAWRNC